MNSNFALLDKIIKTNNYISKQLINYNNNYKILKNNIEETMYDLIKLAHSYLIENIYRVKEKYLKEILVNISMLDYYAKVSYDLKCVSKKKYVSMSSFLLEEKKIVYGLIKYEKNHI